VPVLFTHGTTDTVVHNNDDPPLGLRSREFWLDRDGCEMATMPTLDGCVAYQGCEPDLPVAYCEHGGGHVVPSNTGANVWDFFSSLE
jgi:hypothetical protein